MKRMTGGSRMVGGAETALLTLDDGQEGAPGAPGGENFIAPTSKPAKFINFKESFAAAKTIIKKYIEKRTPNKKDLKLASSELFDIYSYATPQARGVFDSSVPLNGFVDELSEGVRLKPEIAKVFFTSLVDLIEETVPDANPPAPTLEAQTALGSGKKSGCGCCGRSFGGAEPAKTPATMDPKVPALKAVSDSAVRLSKPQQGNVVNNVLEWIKKKRAAMGDSGKTEAQPKDKTLEQLAKENDKAMPPIGRGVSSLPALMEEKKRFAGRARPVYGMVKKQVLPGRIEKLRAKIAAQQESSSESESESDEETKGGNKTEKHILKLSKNNPITLKAIQDMKKLHGKDANKMLKESLKSMKEEKKEEKEHKKWLKAKSGTKRVNKRAEIVKSVMAKRGVSMIEASKIVKAEGLY
jgi:hypothetical protein